MLNIKQRFELQSVRNKIIIAFILGCLVVLFSWAVAHIVFKETFLTIDKIAEPNPKLRIVTSLFQKVNRLEQSQKLQLLKNPSKQPVSFIEDSRQIIQYLDTLQILYAEDTTQIRRLELMKNVLLQRDKLLYNYIKFHGDLINNKSLSSNMRELSDFITDNMKQTDSIVTTKKIVTTTTTLGDEKTEVAAEKQESFIKRLFSKKKNNPEKKHITENIITIIDTLSIAQRDSFMKDMESAISNIEKEQYTKGSKLVNHELKLANANNAFINELQQLLQQIQDEEITDLQNDTLLLRDIFTKAFNRIGIILLIFLLFVIVLVYLIFFDIRQSNKNQLELIEAKEKAQNMEKVKERFLANMSHEIRTPLQSIIGYAEQIHLTGNAKKEHIDAIHRSSEHLLQIVNEILDYSRITCGKFIFEKTNFTMQEVLAEVCDNIESQAEKKHIAFRFKSDIPDHTKHTGDSFRLKQILYNLLSNAVKFTNDGEVSFFVTAKDTPKKTEFCFEVKDTGIGMTPEEIKKIFSAFEQANDSTQRNFGGTGLGLGIAKTLVEMQSGQIDVTSQKNLGSTFTVKLGYLKAPMSPIIKEELKQTEHIFFEGKVLIVDDDKLILNLCSAILQKKSIKHVCYNSPEELLKSPWDPSVTLVLVDISMPNITGIELLQKLKQFINYPVTFIALTAQVLPDERKKIIDHGFDMVLLKPFKENDILQLFADFDTSDKIIVENTDEIIDLSSIKTMCGNDPKLLKQTLEQFVIYTRADVELLKDALTKNDKMLIDQICHKLAGRMGQTGSHNIVKHIRKIENNLESKTELDLLQSDFNILFAEFNHIINSIQNYITNDLT